MHTHSPWASALAAAQQPLVIAQMDMTPLHNDCAFLGDWPGVPIAGLKRASSSPRRSVISVQSSFAHHGYLTAGKTCEEATYLAVYLERAARMQIRAQAFGPLTPVNDDLAKEAHDYLLKPSIVNTTFSYWARQTHGIAALCEGMTYV
ncbi:class II aldolase/adducin family protein [Cupriavidus basilensis]